MKKNRVTLLIITISVIAAAIAVYLIFFTPQPIAGSTESLSINAVKYRGQDVTDSVDCQSIKDLLARYSSVATLRAMSSYPANSVIVEIDANNSGKPLHILLGEGISVCYEAAGQNMRVIQNGEILLEELEKLMGSAR